MFFKFKKQAFHCFKLTKTSKNAKNSRIEFSQNEAIGS
jgi:hypothetical protein